MQPEGIFSGPIPGQSLTQDPDAPAPYEMPPKFTTVNQSLDYLFNVVTSKGFMENFDKLLDADKRFYVDALVCNMLEEGFINGLWSVDLMSLLVEPFMILMIWAAAQLNRSPTFSNDTGYEDRTGYEELMGMMEPDELPTAPAEEPEEPIKEPTSPLTNQVPASPLTGGL